MKKVLKLIIIGLLIQFKILAQNAPTGNYMLNGGFENGLNTGWTHSVANGAKASFKLTNDSYVMEGTVSLSVKVSAKGSNIYSIKSSSASVTLGADSIYLLRFWAKGSKRASKMYVSIEGVDTNRVLYEMHTGRQLFHLPFKTHQKNITVNFYPQDAGIVYAIDGAEILDQNNDKGVDVLYTYIWNNKRTCSAPTWLAGDNDISFQLPDGRKMWFFNDSFYGDANDTANNPFYKAGNFIRNSYVLEQTDGNLIGMGSSDKNNNGQRAYFETVEEILEGNVQKNFYWLRTAIMEHDTVKLYLVELDETGGLHDTKRSYLAKFSYPALEFLGIEKQADFCFGYELMYVENDTIYLFKTDNHLARTPVGNLIGAKLWEFWNGSSWVTDPAQAVKVSNNQNDGVMRLSDGNYVQVAKPYLSRQLQVSFASAPQGPWTTPVAVYNEPNDSSIISYMANFHSKLSNGKYSVSYSMNQAYDLFGGTNESFVDKYWYRPRYVQVDLNALSPYSKKYDCAGVENGTAYFDNCKTCVGGTTGLKPCVTGVAILYPDCDFNGDEIGLKVGDYNFGDLQTLGFTANTISSIKVDQGYEVVLFDQDSLKGNSVIINSNVACLTDNNFDNQTMSLLVRRFGTPGISGTYIIQNKLSGLYMGLKGGSTTSGTTIIQTKFKANETQHFTINPVGNGYYTITNVASDFDLNAKNISEGGKIEIWDGAAVDLTNLNGTVSAQYNDSPTGEGFDKLIDNSAQTKFLTFHEKTWVQYQLPKAYSITGYSITSANDADGRDPLNWTLRGSNDGNNWTLIDTLSNQDFPNRFQEKVFTVSNSNAYSYFRLDMVSNVGTILQLAEWKLFASVSDPGILDSKFFVIQDAGNEEYKIFSKSNDKLLEILDYGVYNEGPEVRQVDDYGQPGGLWKFVDIHNLPSAGCDSILGSSATLDECGICVGGATGKDSCKNTAVLFSDCNLSGNMVGLNEGEYLQAHLVSLGLTNNSLSSIKVKQGYKAELFDYDNFGGKTITVVDVDSCLVNKSMDNKVSSLKIITVNVNVTDNKTSMIAVYPNPVSKRLFISGIQDNFQLEVLNLQGQKVIESKSGNSSASLEVSELQGGVYILKVISCNKVASFRFLKQ